MKALLIQKKVFRENQNQKFKAVQLNSIFFNLASFLNLLVLRQIKEFLTESLISEKRFRLKSS